MPSKVVWILGDQLYYWSPFWSDSKNADASHVVMWESPHFFKRRTYHMQKLTYMFSAMRRFAQFLEDQGFEVIYYACTQDEAQVSVEKQLERLQQQGVNTISMFRPASTEQALIDTIQTYMKLEWLSDTNFITSEELQTKHFSEHDSFQFASFYRDQRLEHEFLLDDEDNPLGGKWSLDEENRESFDEDVEIPEREAQHSKQDQRIIEEVKSDLKERDQDMGANEQMIYPISPEAARSWIQEFLHNRLEYFGTYQDAIKEGESYGFHSVISPFLNVGILHVQEVLDMAYAYYQEHTDKISLNQIEGFLRQIIGWREYVKYIYDAFGSEQRTRNVFNCQREVPDALWTGETGLIPIDEPLERLLKTGYLHHIERLMIFGNFMLLCEIHPDEVFEWFMRMFVDAYDWVMVPNVYGMSQFADGGTMMTKPYISSSNYILKMSNYEDDGYWTKIWDALFWEFIRTHKEELQDNARMGLMLNLYEKKSEEDKEAYRHTKEEFLKTLYGG